MMTTRVTIWISAVMLLAACAEPPPPRSVNEFLENPIVLEAALVRCSQNRSETRYEAECVNAREANKVVAAREEAARRAEFEAQSERKRQALRRTQEAAATARRRAEEAKRRREEAAYLAQFGELPPDADSNAGESDTGNVPMAVIPEPEEVPETGTEPSYSEPLTEPSPDTGNAPTAETEVPQDIGEIRDELRRRSEDETN
jgi:membrane-bound lytic murein transglycosylase